MVGFIEGEDRFQATLFPEELDEYITEDNPVRVIDIFVDALDLSGLGFKMHPAQTGRPGYSPSVMLKLYIYGYLNRIQSSRRLERESGRNVELMWLLKRLAPDFKTIANFRKDNPKSLRQVCREFVVLCRNMELFADNFVAIDGSKFKASNHKDKNFTRSKLKARFERIDKMIAEYLTAIDNADRQSPDVGQVKVENLEAKISKLKEQMAKLKIIEAEVEASPDKQISMTDPDARSMRTRGIGTGALGYNVQTAVDAKHHIIVEHEVTNVGNDRAQLANMAKKAKAAIGCEKLNVVADKGYYKGEEILECERHGITSFLPKTYTCNNLAKGLFEREDFIYNPKTDSYTCPAGKEATYRTTREESGKIIKRYWSSSCRQQCHLKDICTTGKERRITRWEHEDVLDALERRMKENPDMMKIRKSTVEHPFGTIKSWMGATHFQMRTKEKVSAEMSLHVLAYNMKRVIKIMGIAPLIKAIKEQISYLLNLSHFTALLRSCFLNVKLLQRNSIAFSASINSVYY